MSPVSKTVPRTVTVTVPLTFVRRGGRKLIIAPDGDSADDVLDQSTIDPTLVKALARAFRWRRQLDEGLYATIDEIAAAEKINDSYVARVLRLTLLAPDIVEAILAGAQPRTLSLKDLLRPFPMEWVAQRSAFMCHPGGQPPPP